MPIIAVISKTEADTLNAAHISGVDGYRFTFNPDDASSILSSVDKSSEGYPQLVARLTSLSVQFGYGKAFFSPPAPSVEPVAAVEVVAPVEITEPVEAVPVTEPIESVTSAESEKVVEFSAGDPNEATVDVKPETHEAEASFSLHA